MSQYSLNNVLQLLSTVEFQLGTFREARKQFSAKLAPEFSLFRYIKSDEMGISQIIADFLNPKGSHGQGSNFLQAFANMLDIDWLISVVALADWKVTTEKQANGQRRIDIWLESDSGIVAIENKPWACDQKGQLFDYARFMEGGKKWLLIYLCNHEPSENSIDKETLNKYQTSKNLIKISYSDLLGWLEYCAAKTRALVVRVFIEEFIDFVRKEIEGEMDMTEENEVVGAILKSPEIHIEAAFDIFNSINSLKEKLLEKFKKDLETALDNKNWILKWDGDRGDSKKNMSSSRCWERYVGFGVSYEDKFDKYLRIEFDGSGLWNMFFGICKDNSSVICDPAIWMKIEDVIRLQGKQTDWWPWYSDNPEAFFGEGYRIWATSEKPWIEMQNGKLVEKIVALAERVREAFGDNQLYLLAPNPKQQSTNNQ